MLTVKEAVDQSIRKTFAQGYPSMNDGTCAYRGENGMKCAIGQIMPDSVYKPDYDAPALGVYGLASRNVLWEFIQKPKQPAREQAVRDMFTCIQAAHDGAAEIASEGEKSFRQAFLDELKDRVEKSMVRDGVPKIYIDQIRNLIDELNKETHDEDVNRPSY